MAEQEKFGPIPVFDNNRNDHEAINEELAAVVGKTRLLINGKFRQFESLIAVYNDAKDNENSMKNKKITQKNCLKHTGCHSSIYFRYMLSLDVNKQ